MTWIIIGLVAFGSLLVLAYLAFLVRRRMQQHLGALYERNEELAHRVSALDERVQGGLSEVRASVEQTRARTAFASRSSAPVAGPLRTVFLIHHGAAWPALRPVFAAMNRAPDFDPVVVSLPHRFPGSASFGGEEAVHLLLTHEGVPHLRCPSADDTALTMVMSLTPSLVFRQAPWDDDLPPSLSTRSLDFVRLAYVPYGLMTAAIEDKQFDQEFHRACWRIFAPVPGHCELAAAHSQVAASNCVVTGYPKFDELVSAAAEPGLWPIEPREGTRLRLIWAPHFSRSGDWLRFGAFDLVAGPLLQWTAEHPDVDVVLRPHPALLEEMREAPDDSDLGRFRFAWDQLPNTAVSSEADYSRLFAASDVLLTDGLSFLSEYQLFDKPVVFFERSDHVGFNEIGQVLLQGLYRVESIDPMIEMLETMLEGFDDPLAPARREVVAQVHCYPGEAATRILTEIRHGLGRPAPGDA